LSNSKFVAVGKIDGDYQGNELHPELFNSKGVFRSVRWYKKDILRSEFDPDIAKSFVTEYRIIKYTLSYLSHCYFVDNTIDAELIRYYQRLDGVSVTPITKEHFRSIEYTPLRAYPKK
jgi:predicted Mrr-cat superfamily restriction endonuclease